MNMYTDEFSMTPLSCRLFLRALVSCSRHAEYIQFLPYASDHSNQSVGLRVSSIDTAGVSVLSWQFEPGFFHSYSATGEIPTRAHRGVMLSARNSARAFKNVSPNRIVSASIRISGEQFDVLFVWKCGVESRRLLRPAEPPENTPDLPYITPETSRPPGRIALSLSPRYLSGLLALIPDSPTLWTLCVSRSGQQGGKLLVSNGAVASSSGEGVSVVGLTLSQSELNRNGSYFVEKEFDSDRQIRVPLSELKSICSIASDEVLKNAYSVQVGFSSFDSFVSETPILAVHVSATNPSTWVNQSHMNLSVQLWFKGCTGLRVDDLDGLTMEDLQNLDEIDTGGDVAQDDEDALLAMMAESIDRPEPLVASSPFIEQSSYQTTQAQESTTVIPEWDSEIPRTPSSVHQACFDDLWL